MSARDRVAGVKSGPLARRIDMDLSPDLLRELGKCLIKAIVIEAMKDYAKRGWSLAAPDGSAPLHKSFRVVLRGQKTIEITSTYPLLQQMTTIGIPPHKMTWATQEAKDKHPANYELTAGERERGMTQSGRVSKGERLPLVIPVSGHGGTVVLRVAPLMMTDAWVHPGVAKFTFLQRGIEKGKAACMERLKQEVVRVIGSVGHA